MRVFLTGATGILGSDILKVLQEDDHEVLAFGSKGINIGSWPDVKNKVLDFKPKMVIHSAALTNVDLCEDDKGLAILTNVIASQNLSQAANQAGAGIVYISSCGVYGNGKTTAYTELDETTPTTYHHFTKLEGEKKVREHNTRSLIVRPGWLFGGSPQHKKNFVEARRKESLGSPVLNSASDKVGSPTYTLDLARQVLVLINEGYTGTFNVVNEGCASRFDYVSEIISLIKSETRVEPVNSNSFPRKANMPDNECLENLNLRLRQISRMRPWKEALKDYISNTYNI